ncbi:MAG: DUF2868 domain-containing protein [Gammaproteobacteria bacterium]|nr:DUF2868 domain-containing protein [Gammaproteobacteria bacterium]
MTVSNFDKRLLIEQIRYMEAERKLACDAEQEFSDLSVHKDFEQRLWQRAKCLVREHDLSAMLGRAARLSRYVKTLALLLAALLGALAVIYAVTDSYTINIYWVLLVLLGFNLLSMLLWLTGISLNMDGLSSGLLARLSGRLSVWLSGHLDSKNHAADNTGAQADRAWLACNFSGVQGKWLLSKLTHQLWLVYLLAGLVFLVLLLMVRQYDFVWGTTLLSDASFIKLTDILSVPLDASGFTTPSAEQVQDTRIITTLNAQLQTAVTQTLNAEHRNHWAQFLLGALLYFGIMPRILLWALSALMCARSRRRFTLDFYLPYYMSLRQQLMPLASHGLVVDADTSPPVISQTAAESSAIKPVTHRLPAEMHWVAVELDASLPWPPVSIPADHNLGEVVDRESLASILQHLQVHKRLQIAVAVSAARAPDRGIQRTIASLMSGSEQCWLVLLQHHQDDLISSKRLAAWYRLAEACHVPADHLISMSMG